MSGKDMSYGGKPLLNGHKPQPQPIKRPSGTSPKIRPIPEGYTIAVDFDGTLCENCYPEIGEPKPLVIKYIKRCAAAGARIILHTCRENVPSRAFLDEAVAFCIAQKIPLLAVNENPGNPYPAQYGVAAGRKLYADLYIDDKCENVADVEARMIRERDGMGVMS